MAARRAVGLCCQEVRSPEGRHATRLLHHADPPARQGLAPIAARRPRDIHPGRRARLQRGLCRRAHHRSGREHHLLHAVPGKPGRPDQADPPRHRHRQPAEHAPGARRRRDRHAGPHARRPAQFRHQPRRPAVRRGGIRHARRRPQRHVRRGDRPGPENMGQRSALRHRRQILVGDDPKDADRRHRPGHHPQAAASAAPPDHRHCRRPRFRRASPKRQRAAGSRSAPTS